MFARLVILALVANSALAAERTVYTNKLKFRIPYQFDAEEIQRLRAKEIRLYVSTDQGLQWEESDRVRPDAKKFSFEAPREGEYWFHVRTVDGKGGMHPPSLNGEAGLAVIVDQSKPELTISLEQPEAGRVRLSWEASDDHLDTASLRLEYHQPGLERWKTMGIIPKANDHTEWEVPMAGIVRVRATIADHAKNSVTTESRIEVTRGSTAPRSRGSREPVAESERGNTAFVFPDRNPSAVRIPREPISAGPMIVSRQGDQNEETIPLRKVPGHFVSQKAGAVPNRIVEKPDRAQPDIQEFNPLATEPQKTPVREVSPESSFNRKIPHRIVNRKKFQIGYKIEDVGPSGVSSVQLFMTDDRGQTWRSIGFDEDRKSPAVVNLPAEGSYGFAILVKSGIGLSKDPPDSGDEPGILVTVDTTPPSVELLPLQQGTDGNSHKLMIQWNYEDEHPAEESISLSYATDREGPWEPIASDLSDSGQYVWSLEEEIPSAFYLRIVALDAAGNRRVLDTPRPVTIDLARPTATILDVELEPK